MRSCLGEVGDLQLYETSRKNEVKKSFLEYVNAGVWGWVSVRSRD